LEISQFDKKKTMQYPGINYKRWNKNKENKATVEKQ